MTTDSSAPRAAAGSGGARNDHHGDGVEQHATGFVTGLRRRRAASWRCVPLHGGRRDPWWYPAEDEWFDWCEGTDRERAEWLAAAELDSWRAAIVHLERLDLLALLPADVAEQLAAT